MPIQLPIPDFTPVDVHLFAGWGHMADQALFGWALLICGLAGLVLQGVLMALVVRRRRAVQRILGSNDPSSDLLRRSYRVWPELCSTVLLLLPLIIEGISLYMRLKLTTAALQPIDPSQPATLLSAEVKERYYGPVLAAMMMAIQTVPAALVIAVGTFYRLKLRGLLTSRGAGKQGSTQPLPAASVAAAYGKHPCPSGKFFLVIALAGGGALAAFWLTIAAFAAQLIENFAGLAGVDPDRKIAVALLGIAEAEAILHGRLLIIAAFTVLIAVAAFVFLHFFAAAARRHRLAPELPRWPRLSRASYAIILALCLGGTVLSLRLAWPFYQEKTTPPPPRTPWSDLFSSSDVVDPALEGPDPFERGPLLQVEILDQEPSQVIVTIDGSEVTQTPADPGLAERRMEEIASRNKENWEQICPQEAFPGLMTLHCDKRARWGQLLPYLRALQRVGYKTMQLAFIKKEIVERPLWGRFPIQLVSTARLHLTAAFPPGLPILDPAGLEKSRLPRQAQVGLRLSPAVRYEEMARAVVAGRRRGNQILIAVGEAETGGRGEQR